MTLPPNLFTKFTNPKGATTKTLQTLLQHIGAATSGTKTILQKRLLDEATSPKPVDLKPVSRILSIDMGIKNLAYCIADVHPACTKDSASPANMKILEWRRLDLTEDSAQEAHPNHEEPRRVTEREAEADQDLFTPSSLSNTAYRLLRSRLLQHAPDTILIERQRWRSSSSSAIQQWTVRVNMLEGMLWAVLRTLFGEREREGGAAGEEAGWARRWRVHGVDPKRVGSFWLHGGGEGKGVVEVKGGGKRVRRRVGAVEGGGNENVLCVEESARKPSKGKLEKKAKIQLLRTWLNSSTPSTTAPPPAASPEDIEKPPAPHYPYITFTFPPATSANKTRLTLLHATSTGSSRSKRTVGIDSDGNDIREADLKKVDDLADCFLQAAAWVAWEENGNELRRQMGAFRETSGDEELARMDGQGEVTKTVKKSKEGKKKSRSKKGVEE